jgi:hypothetical protein
LGSIGRKKKQKFASCCSKVCSPHKNSKVKTCLVCHWSFRGWSAFLWQEQKVLFKRFRAVQACGLVSILRTMRSWPWATLLHRQRVLLVCWWTTLEEDYIAFSLQAPKCTNCIKQV